MFSLVCTRTHRNASTRVSAAKRGGIYAPESVGIYYTKKVVYDSRQYPWFQNVRAVTLQRKLYMIPTNYSGEGVHFTGVIGGEVGLTICTLRCVCVCVCVYVIQLSRRIHQLESLQQSVMDMHLFKMKCKIG